MRGRWERINDLLQAILYRIRQLTYRVYNASPPAALYLLSLLSFWSIPIGLFLTYASICTAIIGGALFVVFAVVNGFWLVIGGGVTLLVNGVIFGMTSFVFFWIGLAWLGYKGVQKSTQMVFGTSSPSGVASTIGSATGLTSGSY